MRGRALLAGATFLFALSAVSIQARGQQPPAGGPVFRVNTDPATEYSTPAVGAGADGSFLVVWESSPYGTAARRIGASGQPVGEEMDLGGTSSPPSMALDGDGGFVVVWSGFYGVWARRFDAGGAPGTELDVSVGYSRFDANGIAMTPGGDFIVIHTAYERFLESRRFDAADRDLGSSSLADDARRGAAIACDSAGDHVVVWAPGPERNGNPVRGRRFRLDGRPLGDVFEVSTERPSRKANPDAAMAPSGVFVAVWESDGQDGDGSGVFAQIYDSRGVPVGRELRVNTGVNGDQVEPAVAMRPDGAFVVVWTSRTGGAGGDEVLGQFFDPVGGRVGVELRINLQSAGAQNRPDVAIGPDGATLLAWASADAENAEDVEVHARRFTGGAGERDLDQDGVADAADNCPSLPNADQADAQADGFGDVCVAPDVVIPADARIGADPIIGQGTVIRSDVTVGREARIGEWVSLGAGMRAGDRVLLEDLVAIGARSRIGNDVAVREGARLELNVAVGAGAEIGDHAVVRRAVAIEARAVIGPLAIVQAGARIGAGATIGMGARIGRRAIVLPGAVVPAGSVVPPGTTVQ